MKSPVSKSVFLLLALAGVAAADLPKKAPISRYSGLWSNSPFTSKPPPPPPGEEVNPLDDYALIGVSPIGGAGYRVTLINKKKPEERITVDSDKPSTGGFKVLEVIRKSGDPLGTTVRMNSGSLPGQPPQPVDPNQPQRQPRPRVVPPPAPQPGAQVQPAQPSAQPVQSQRPSRR
jgi:hypothetical protein